MMITTSKLIAYLNQYLRISDIPDNSKNGLQVQGAYEIEKVAVAVDACMETFEAAATEKAQMLIVHHGIFWNEIETLTGYHHKRVKFLMDNQINLYAAHIPLDVHNEVGNNVQLAKLLDLELVGEFGEYHGLAIGVQVKSPKPLQISELTSRIKQRLGAAIRIDQFGPEEIKTIGIVTGGGASLIPQAVAAELDCFVTGEPKHGFYHFGKECGINLIYGGHYATETLGVKALAEHLENKFDITTIFVDRPTGL
ncbi:MAG: Nif3-like dinuclear metal center hexameric protein [bacterium]